MFTFRFAQRKIVRAKGDAPLKPREAGNPWCVVCDGVV